MPLAQGELCGLREPPFHMGKGLRKLGEGQGCNGEEQQCLTPAKAAAAGQHRALKVAKPPHEKASPAFNVSTLREKEESSYF